MPYELHLNCESAQERAQNAYVRRIFLKAEVQHPVYEVKCSRVYEAVIDTGATMSSIPMHVIEDFRQKSNPLKPSTPRTVTFADGSKLENAPTYGVRLILHAPGRKGEPKRNQRLTPDMYDFGSTALYCLAYENVNEIIIGMDWIRHWRLVVDSRMNEYCLVVREATKTPR